ncbi:glucan biosynthesis protein [Desulfovibrio sp. TomC]|uniref:glucan biosynthesis protein n=1 Tax=Desulfovibrio sp. TomC TaxID=1562888 RepID=UPI0005736507|nr:glucan biosynthesis protein G [Desulfovibrio sp. TomC]KHK01496.1 Glucans biosynthesis protein G precursor [Desulfovibrio sp. TomC]
MKSRAETWRRVVPMYFMHSLARFSVALVFAAFLSPALAALAAAGPFTFENVVQEAQKLATVPFQAPPPIPEALRKLDYDTWRKIRFRPDTRFFAKKNSPYELQFFHPGFLYDRTVKLHSIDGDKVEPLVVTKAMFDYSQVKDLADQLPTDIGAAGFRIHSAINTKSYLDEFTVFLGASYFRAVAKGQAYGLSARGLAINTAEPEGEEFPWFREFWIVKPTPANAAKGLTIYALLDSDSLTGAYAFTIAPGRETVMDVTSRIFPRTPIKKLGIAPLTSMFLYGENSLPGSRMDWRPEVHDSDGLLVHFGNGEWLWRPAQNPATLLVNGFEADSLKGFGLLQRDTEFNNYQDTEARYEKRPSLWIEPRGDWGPGRVEMVLIPSDQEIHDNVVAYFSPKATVAPGTPLRFDYRMRWLEAPAGLPPGVRATATRSSQPDKDSRFFVVDFQGDKLPALKPDAKAEAVVSVGPGAKLLSQQCFRNPVTGGFRLTFAIAFEGGSTLQGILPEKRAPIELRAFLKFDDKSVSETWSYAVTPGKS